MDKNRLQIADRLTDSQIHELIKHSAEDTALLKWTSDPVRFKDLDAVQKWLSKKPHLTVLTDSSGILLGLAWVEECRFPDVISNLTESEKDEIHTTSAIRLYGSARGQGLGAWFFQLALNRYSKVNLWSRISADNEASIRTHQKLGFKQVTQADVQNKVILVRYSPNN